MTVRAFAWRSLRWGLVLLALVAVMEGWVRWRLYSDDPAYATWRDPDLYTWRYTVDDRVVRSDEHAKLAVRWGLLHPDTTAPHALLGWCGDLDSATMLPRTFKPGINTHRVVLLGASWAGHDIPQVDGTEPDVVDLSVPGFAFDQDLLLFDSTFHHLAGSHVLLAIDLDRLDLLQRSFVGRPKPWYTLGPYAGFLHGVPVPGSSSAYLEEHPARPGLYAYHLFRSLALHDTTMSGSAVNAREKDLWELSKKLLFAMLRNARDGNIQVTVLFEQSGLGALADRRRWALQELCRSLNTPSLVLAQEAEAVRSKDQVAMLRSVLALALDSTSLIEHTTLDQLEAIQRMPEEKRTPLQRRMATILSDAGWLSLVRDKARASGVPLAVMVERDARYVMEHDPH